MRKAFVIGWPIAHSKSPVLHEYWLKYYGISGSYEAIAIAPEKLEEFVKQLPSSGLVGGNVTIPHKETILDLASSVDDSARRIGAANTIWLENNRIMVSNTDAYGFSANLDDHAPGWRHGHKATILGAGGASRAVIYALLEAGYRRICIVNRTLARAEHLVERFGNCCSAHEWQSLAHLLKNTDLLVNSTSLGMEGVETKEMFSLDGMPSQSIVTDLVYNPLQTALLKTAREAGLKTVDGLGMLLHQAVPGFERWFGVRPEVTSELREHILSSD